MTRTLSLLLLLLSACSITAPPEFTLNPASTTGFQQVSAGDHHVCGLQTYGKAHCWGLGTEGQTNAPNVTFTALGVGDRHSCGLEPGGSVRCWGRNTEGQAKPHAGPFTQLSVGSYHTCGLSAQGIASCWGSNGFGQLDVPNASFTQLSAGEFYTCGVAEDGAARCWGDDRHGQATPAEGRFTQVSAGSLFSCGLLTGGTARCWGDSIFGDVPAGSFTRLSTGYTHACGLRGDGTARCWGDNGSLQLDAPTGSFTDLSAGEFYTCGVRVNGSVVCWGDTKYSGVTPPPPANHTLSFTTAPSGLTRRLAVGRGINGPAQRGVVVVTAVRRGGRGNTARVVGQEDKVLIVAPNRRALEPNARGGLIDLNFVRFGRRVTVASLELSDVTTPGGRVELWGGGRKLGSTVVPLGENTLTLEIPGVTRLRIFLTGPGAVDDVVVTR